jgi:WD40 repeat protein
VARSAKAQSSTRGSKKRRVSWLLSSARCLNSWFICSVPRMSAFQPATDDEDYPKSLRRQFDDIHTGNILQCRTLQLSSSALEEAQDVLLTTSVDKSVRLTCLKSGIVRQTLALPRGSPLIALDGHPLRSDLLLLGSMDGCHYLVGMTMRDSVVVKRFKDHSKHVVRVAFSADGAYFCTASSDQSILIYAEYSLAVRHGLCQETMDDTISVTSESGHAFSSPNYVMVYRHPFKGAVEGLCYTRDSFIATVRKDNYIHQIWLPNDKHHVCRHSTWNMNETGDDHSSFTAMDVAPSPRTSHDPRGGQYLLVFTDQSSGRIMLFRTGAWDLVHNFYGPKTDMFSLPRLCWHMSGKYFVANSDLDCSLYVFEIFSGQCTRVLGGPGFDGGHSAIIRCMFFDETRKELVTGAYDKSVRIWG